MRQEGWPELLAAVVEEWRHRPFAYGSADCFQFAGAVVLAVTGVDYRDRFPHYGSGLQALRILRNTGDVEGLLGSLFGAPKPVARAQRADIVTSPHGSREPVRVCVGHLSCSPGPSGLVFVPTLQAAKAWGV